MIIVITGTSSGIGWCLAEHLGKQGHRVYGLSRKTSQSPFFTSIGADVCKKNDVEMAIRKVLEKENRIDILINNAGIGMVGAVEDSAAEDISKIFQLNLIAAVHLMQEVLPVMRMQNSGKILNISSIGSEMGLPFRGFYSASKSALDKVTEALRYEIYPWKIQVAALHLGDIKTEIANHRLQVKVSKPYQQAFGVVHGLMNTHVREGFEPKKVAIFIEKLIAKKTWKAHYTFGKIGQKIALPLKKLLPQFVFERLMRRYNHIGESR